MKTEIVQRLWMQHYAKMYRVARSILYDEQESKDVISDVFESLLKRSIALIPETEEHYLMTSVRNQCFKRLAHENVKREMEQECRDNTGVHFEDDRLDGIDELVNRSCSAQDQRIFKLRFYDGCSYEDISMIEGISKVAVWKHLSRITIMIKKSLKSGK